MESTILHHGCFKPLPTTKKLHIGFPKPTRNPKPTYPYRICAVLAHSDDKIANPLIKSVEDTKTIYNDSWFDLLAINHLSQSVQKTTGIKNEKEGYDGLIVAASTVARNFEVNDQQILVVEALKRAIPKSILQMIKTVAPPSTFSREFFAVFTTVFFPWLIGKCEARESQFEGKKEKNVVYIPKCRFLEGTNCVAMCTNLCKMPSQKFIKDSLGMPMYMKPNFDDMSCEMIFGQNPPEDDPALSQPCYKKLCIAKKMHGVDCST